MLVGLIFVAISINMERLLKYPSLLSRAADAVVILMTALVAAMLLLVPGLSLSVLAWSMIVLGAVSAVWILLRGLGHRRTVEPAYRRNSDLQTGIATVCMVAFVVAGVSILAGAGGGVYWLVPAGLGSLAIAVLDSWVLLVEINR